MDFDECLAIQLQSEFDKESGIEDIDIYQASNWNNDRTSVKAQPKRFVNHEHEMSLRLCDEYWELTDPNPDVHALFIQFDERFFRGKLAGVEVRWSPRMTLCAGLCHYEGRGGMCSVRLSSPLLKLRPRCDLINTLLHEMIHAYLFVTHNFKGHDAHGPEFCKQMHRINEEAGTEITVYHTFHDEVKLYKQHWWKCNGPCRRQPPYYGIVKRSMNRNPGPQDFWWNKHLKACGGTYEKIKEPDGYSAKKKSKDKSKSAAELNNFKGGISTKTPGVDVKNVTPFGGQGRILGGRDKTGLENPSSTRNISNRMKTDESNAKTRSPLKQTNLENWRNRNLLSTFDGNATVTSSDYYNRSDRIDSDRSRSTAKPSNERKRKHTGVKIEKPSTMTTFSDDKVPETSNDSSRVGKQQQLTVVQLDDDNDTASVKCPVCGRSIAYSEINSHLDNCL